MAIIYTQLTSNSNTSTKVIGLLGIASCAILLPTPKAQALSIVYTPLPLSVELQATVVPGDNTSSPSNWTYFSFDGVAGEQVFITGRRVNGELDVAFGVWDGLEADTSDYFDIFSDSLNFTLIAFADDELPPAVPGPFGDPTASFTLPITGSYSVAFTSFLSADPTAPFDFTVQREVPGPLPALGAAAAFGFSRKLRKRIKGGNNAVSSTYTL